MRLNDGYPLVSESVIPEEFPNAIRATALEREVRNRLISLDASFQAFKAEDEKWKKNVLDYLLTLQPPSLCE